MTYTDFERRLAQHLRAESARAVDSERAWHDVQERHDGRRRRERWMAAVVAVAAVVTAVTIPAVVAQHAGQSSHRRSETSYLVTPGKVGTFPGAVVARISTAGVAPGATFVAGASGVAWIPMGPLAGVDLRTNKIKRSLSLPDMHAATASIAAGAGALWLPTGNGESAGQVLRLNPVTGGIVGTLHLPVPGSCSGAEYGGGGVWVACPARDKTEFLRIDPATSRVNARLGPVPGTIYDETVTPESLWYASNGGVSGFIRADGKWRAVTVNAIIYPMTVPLVPDSIVYGLGFIWVMTPDGTIARIDPATGRITKIFTDADYDLTLTAGLSYLAVGARSLWLVGYQGQMLRVNAATGRPLGWIPALGYCGAVSFSELHGPAAGVGEPCSRVDFAAGSVWVATNSTLFRIDPTRMPG